MKLNDLISEQPTVKKNKSWLQPDLKPWMYKTKEEIEQWMKEAKIPGLVSKELEIHPSGTNLQIGNLFRNGPKESLVEYDGKWLLPVQFHLAPGHLEVVDLAIESMIGLPRLVLGRMTLDRVAIEDFEGCPKHITGSGNDAIEDIRVESSKPIKSFVGCPDVDNMSIMTEVIGIDGLPRSLTRLGLSHYSNIREIIGRCPNLRHLMLADVVPGENGLRPLDVFKSKIMVDTYFYPKNWAVVKVPDDYKQANTIINKHLKSKERSVIDCQEELIDSNLKDWAD